MTRPLAIALLVSLFCVASSARDGIERTESSPSGRITIRHSARGVARQIWLASRNFPSRRTLLYEHNRYAEVLFSRDERWIAITDYYFSNESEVVLFRKKRELEYEQVEAVNVSAKAWDFFAEENHLTEIDLHHTYVKAVRWLPDSRSLLVSLDGYGDKHRLDPWFFTFDVSRLEPKPYPRRDNLRAYRNLS
jgi:hypothetical protein